MHLDSKPIQIHLHKIISDRSNYLLHKYKTANKMLRYLVNITTKIKKLIFRQKKKIRLAAT